MSDFKRLPERRVSCWLEERFPNYAEFHTERSKWKLSMALIREVVQQAITNGYLTVAAENQLRQLLTTKYDREDLKAFMTLQQAVIDGRVKQEARELIRCHCALAS